MTRIVLENGQLFYSKKGRGRKIILAFHGFGQDNEIFTEWVPFLEDEYTIYSFDLFYHGRSERVFGKLSKSQWASYLNAFLKTEKIDEFSIIGFSLGGRFAISTALSFPERINELTLIAPDGIYLSSWFKLATKPILRSVFKYFMVHPTRLDELFKLNESVRLISPYLHDFAKKELGNLENRKRVYRSWNDFKSLGYSKNQLFTLFNRYDFQRTIILGSKDHIIQPDSILPTIEKMGTFKIKTLPLKHHQLIKPEVAKLISNNHQ